MNFASIGSQVVVNQCCFLKETGVPLSAIVFSQQSSLSGSIRSRIARWQQMGLDILSSKRDNCRDRPRGDFKLLISDLRYLAVYMSIMSWLIWCRPDQMHIKTRLSRVALATKMVTDSLTKTINRVDNWRGL
jgi:hypothetical protein